MDLSTVTSTKDSKTRNSIRKDKANDQNDYIRSIHSTSNQKNEYISKKKYIDLNNPTSATIELTHNLYNQNNNDDDDNTSNDSMETVSDEIPIWVHGEQRWISGVNDNTTCSDLVNVLLADEGITSASTTINNTVNKGFVITEKWRRVEQILNDDTKILKIWSAWGHAKSEVKLTLRQINTNLSNDWTPDDDTTAADNTLLSCILNNNDKDSGMGSPNGSSNSAIIRRKKHRASKTSAAWLTQHAQSLHPKSQKATIEKLMKLILEQGETIQQQLAKLRDRELEITKIEEERHKTREKEHGKNYLLETYLNGLHEIDEKEIVIGTSDSGVQTEGVLSSNEICQINENENYLKQSNQNTKTNEIELFPKYNTLPFKEKKSHREKKLLKEHKNAKEFSTLLQQQDYDQEKYQKKIFSSTNVQIKCSTPKKIPSTKDLKNIPDLKYEKKLSIDNADDDYDDELNVTEKIEWLEKLIIINKHLQREEELLVRLGAKLRKLESDDPLLDEKQILEQINQLNDNLVHGNDEITKIENDIIISKEILKEKQIILNKLNDELLNAPDEMENFADETENQDFDKFTEDSSTSAGVPSGNKKTEIDDKFSILPSIITLNENPSDLNKNIFNNDKIVENLYSYSQYISKPNYEYNIRNENIINDMKLIAQPATISNEPNIERNNEHKVENLIAPQIAELSNPSNYLPIDSNISLMAKQQKYQFDATAPHPLTNPANSFYAEQHYSTLNQEQLPNVTSEMLKLNHPLPTCNQSILIQQHQQQFIVNQRQQNLISKAPVLNCKNQNPIISKINTNKSIGIKCNQNTIQNQSINLLNNQKFEQQKKIKFHFENDDINLISNENSLNAFKQTKHDTNLINIYGLEQFNNLPKQNQKLNGKKLTSILKSTANNDCKLNGKKLISNSNSNDIESNSDTGLSSMSEDITNIGTLV